MNAARTEEETKREPVARQTLFLTASSHKKSLRREHGFSLLEKDTIKSWLLFSTVFSVQNLFRELFAKLYPELIEGIKPPKNALTEHFMLIKGQKLAKIKGRQPIKPKNVGGLVPSVCPRGVCFQPSAFKSFDLRVHMRKQNGMMLGAQAIILPHADKIGGNGVRSLMKPLVKLCCPTLPHSPNTMGPVA